MKRLLIIGTILLLCFGCKESKTDWKAVYDSLNDDYAEYSRSGSKEVYNKIISKCDLLTESSPEFRNAALMIKSSVLAFSYQYDEAVKVAEMIPDTASVFYVFRPKSVYINELFLLEYTEKDWALFVEAFPKSYDEFINLYGYDGDEMSLLYHEAYDHIAFLFSDDRILEPECLDMLLKLTHGYYWQADAATYLHMHVESMLKAHPDFISAFLKDKDDDLVKDFLKCAIATCHPEPENTVYYNKYLKLVELYEGRSPKIVRLFKAAHAELMEEWCE